MKEGVLQHRRKDDVFEMYNYSTAVMVDSLCKLSCLANMRARQATQKKSITIVSHQHKYLKLETRAKGRRGYTTPREGGWVGRGLRGHEWTDAPEAVTSLEATQAARASLSQGRKPN